MTWLASKTQTVGDYHFCYPHRSQSKVMNRRKLKPIFLYRQGPRFTQNTVNGTEKGLAELKCANELLEAVNSASNTARLVYITLLSFSMFLAFTTGTISDEKLLYDRTAILPLVENVELPLSTFYFVTPWILVFIHAEAIIHFTLLTKKLNALHIILRRVSINDREYISARISNFPFSYWLFSNQKYKPSKFIIGALVWFPLFVLPVLVLVFSQLAFLPYQSEIVTWSQRLSILADVVLLIALYPVLRDNTEDTLTWWRDALLFWRCCFSHRFLLRLRHRYSLWRYVRVRYARRKNGAFRLLAICVTAIVITWFVATIPGETWETALISCYTALGGTTLDSSKSYGMSFGVGRSGGHVDMPSEFSCGVGFLSVKVNVYEEGIRPPSYVMRAAYPLDAYLPEGMVAICPTVLLFHSGNPWLRGFHRTLNARELTIVSSKVSDDIELRLRSHDESKRREAIGTILPINLRGRNFRFGDFSAARLPKADLRDINAEGVRFNDALLESAKFTSFHTNLLGANFNGAELGGANFDNANMALASFRSAKLQGASFSHTKMYGVDLSSADLRGASLSYAYLLAANLFETDMTAADLAYADMRTAQMNYSKLLAASLYVTDLRGATLQNANLTGAEIIGAAIDGADFTRTITRLNLIDLSTSRGWDKPDKDEFLNDMQNVGLYQLGLNRLDPKGRPGSLSNALFHPTDCGGSSEMARTYACIDVKRDTHAKSNFARRFFNNWANTACLDNQDPIVVENMVRRIPYPNIAFLGSELFYFRSAVPGFSRRLFLDRCLPASHLDKGKKAFLREWVRRANSNTTPEITIH